MTKNDLILLQVEGWIIGDINKDFSLEVKEDSKLMRILSKLLFFNKSFMSGYITTIYPKVYYPREGLKHTHRVWRILAHEGFHLWSAKRLTPVLHGLLYLFPQILALLALLSLLAIWFSNWWLLCLLFLLCAAPLPAPFRMKEEMNAYHMNMCIEWWLYGEIPDSQLDHIADKFLKSDYYWMWPFEKAIYKRLKKGRKDIMSGKYNTIQPYDKVRKIIHGTSNIYVLPPRG